MRKPLVVFLLAITLITTGATKQPTSQLTVIGITRDWFGNERGVGEGVPVYVYNRFGRLALRGETGSFSSTVLELPPDTYTIYLLYDLGVSPFVSNDCFTPPYVLDEPEEVLVIRCARKSLLRLPWMKPR